jgi:hypothetical protein
VLDLSILKNEPPLASQDERPEEPDFQHCPRTQALIASFGDQDTFAAVLRLLVKIIAPPSSSTEKLGGALRRLSNNFIDLKERIESKTRRTELRRRLQLFSDQARQLHGELENFKILSRLVDAARDDWGSCAAEDVDIWRRVLEDLPRLAAIAAGKIPKGKGAKRDDGDISAEELCAFMVRRAWYTLRGEWPGLQSEKAWDACEELWIVAGGKASGAEGSPEKWRRHLEHASLPRRQGANGAAFLRDGDGRIVLVEARLPENSTPEA